MKSRILGLAVSLVCLATWQASAQTLVPGGPAPALEVSRWVKGEKIDKLEKDQTYVVEFWATWCGPCKATIPHLTELQKKYKDKGIKFIGVSILEEDQKAVEPFVKKMGDKMDYSVALDAGIGDSGKMAKSWMEASGSAGIPTAFLVKNGKVAWIGHPTDLDKALEKVVEPNYELAKFLSWANEVKAKEEAEAKAKEKRFEGFKQRMAKLGASPTPKQIVEALDQSFQETPELESMFGLQKYGLMIQSGDKGAAAYALKLIDGPFKDNVEELNALAWANLDDEGEIPANMRDSKMALKAALRANEVSKGKEGEILNTLALAYFKNGDPAKAVETQEKAIKLTPEPEADMAARLKKYQKAVADKSKP
jgi:thiol-disulfide isomerase/thioredoxin